MSLTQLYTKNIDNEYHKVHWSGIKMTGLVKLLTKEQQKELKELLR